MLAAAFFFPDALLLCFRLPFFAFRRFFMLCRYATFFICRRVICHYFDFFTDYFLPLLIRRIFFDAADAA